MSLLKKKEKKQANEKFSIEPFLYLTPFLIGVCVFTLYPVINVFVISFQENYNMMKSTYTGFGLDNFVKVFSDADFMNALKNTSLYVLFVVPISTCLSLFVANLLNKKLRFSALFQTAFFLPMVTSVTAIGLAWKWMYNYDYGVINYFLSIFGISSINWLNDVNFALPALIIYGIWSIMPFTIILFLSGLQNINEQYYTAAKVDGASSSRIFFKITVPLLAPTTGLILIVNTISTSKVFNELFPLFSGKPGPAYSLYTVVYYIYDAFQLDWQLGKASAAAVILFLIVFVFTMLQLWIQRKWKHY
ncbi:MAG: sugar ABC transporter permease [Erysipelotrichaceae bacterium]